MDRPRGTKAVAEAVAVLLVLSVTAALHVDRRSLTPLPAEEAGAARVTAVELGRLMVAPFTSALLPAPPVLAALAPPPSPPPAPPPRPGDSVISPPPATFDAPAPAPLPPPPALRRDPQFSAAQASGGTWAVSIGINDYPGGGHDLRSAVNDATDVDQALEALGVPADHRLLLRNAEASAAVVRRAAEWLVAHAAPDAVAVFFYAGHVRKLSSETEAIVAADGDLVTDAALADLLAQLPARRAWVAIAACYGGGFTELLAPGRVLSAAAGANSLAYENSKFARSYMVEYMVHQAMIERRAPDSVQAAFAYAQAALSRDYPGREPVQADAGSAPLDLRPPGAPRPPPADAPAGPPPEPPPGGGAPPTTQPPRCLIIFSCSGKT